MEGFDVAFPDIEIPDIEIPDVDIPDADISDFEIPEVDILEIEMPEIPEMEFDSKARRTNRNANRRVPQQHKGNRVVKVQVNDYIRCSVCTVTFCNFMFLGTSALVCSLKVKKQP